MRAYLGHVSANAQLFADVVAGLEAEEAGNPAGPGR
jgi:hypothetical protein